MSWGIGCGTKAGKVYRQRMLMVVLLYLAVVLAAAVILRHGHPTGWALYFVAITPAVPVLIMLVYLGIYLRDEIDEYMRMVAMRSLLVATGALLATIVVSDVLRSFTSTGPLPPFSEFMLFFLSFAAAQGVQRLMNRGGGDD